MRQLALIEFTEFGTTGMEGGRLGVDFGSMALYLFFVFCFRVYTCRASCSLQ